jgi:pilus assembly protein Flp/PilA
MFKRLFKNRKGQGFVEYALLIVGVAMVGLIGVTILGVKTNHMISALALTLPGPNNSENNKLNTGTMLEVEKGANTFLQIGYNDIALNRSTGNFNRLHNNLTGDTPTGDTGLDPALVNPQAVLD